MPDDLQYDVFEAWQRMAAGEASAKDNLLGVLVVAAATVKDATR